MRLQKVKAWKAISKSGEVATFTNEEKANDFAEGGIVNETFTHVAT